MALINSIAFSPSAMTMSSPSTPCSSRARRTKPASAGLSSTRRMETGCRLRPVPLAFRARYCKEKRRTPSKRGFDPDFSAGPFDDPLADGEAHAGARIVGGAVKTLEDFKDLLLV